MTIQRTLAALLPFFGAMNAAQAADREWPLEWHWISVTPNSEKNWAVEQGQVQVTFHGHTFEATLKDGNCLLKGTIANGKVAAIETLIGTDARPQNFHGDARSIRTKLSDASNGWGEDRISLFAPGGFYVGLFRRVRSGTKPGQ